MENLGDKREIKALLEVANLIGGEFETALIYLERGLKIRSLISSLNSMIITLISAITSVGVIMDSYFWIPTPVPKDQKKTQSLVRIGLSKNRLKFFFIQVANLNEMIIAQMNYFKKWGVE
ncbi:hypothetical protein BKH46_07970 [Helicobacter sp. 12S02634-8]|uniref:hypothetical protein n=1 Tax=Helicobacter sp. 12S02634-8 TaxID=1476199 RepID=UPI000BA555BB|nr:hypothetical protein [Helicobacter sp. 12S02634-8]PAF46313.1 hypothetical protein BKH46_07970 [Helicobacter sp. 12S02634-8]